MTVKQGTTGVIDVKALLEGDGQQERKEDLHPGLGDAQLLQLLSEVAIDPVGLGLVAGVGL